MNATSSNVNGLPVNINSLVLVGVFSGLTNNDSTQVPSNGQISFQITVRAFNASALAGNKSVEIATETYVDGNLMTKTFKLNLKVTEKYICLI